ncbi:hypothetical protein [Cytobacillus praedii]|uniref:hypothetical protein n=1 Tax=Cytobacillus praedii TaxID=1742358 RepID=UPI002E20C0E2|nr:hypothetical protein [Cytobacillus praedii]
MKLNYSRLIKSFNFELFTVKAEQFNFEYTAIILFVDTKRKSKLSDFPLLEGIESEEEFDTDPNHIKVLLISPIPLSKEYIKDIMIFTESMLSHTFETSFYVHEVIKDINSIEFSKSNRKPLLNFIEPLIKDACDNKYETILDMQSFKYLTQNSI